MSDIVCISPIDGSEVARFAAAMPAEIEASIAAARTAQAAWKRVPIPERARLLTAFVEAMLAMKDEIGPELTRQMGRPIRYAAGELNGFAERARHMIAIAEKTLAPVMPEGKEGFTRYIRRDPVGVVLTIAPWNYPYLTAVNTVVPALMAGNAVILKHAAQTILVGKRFQMAADKAGLPKGLFQWLVLGHEDTTRLIASGAIDHVAFTGSVEAGRAIERAAAGTFASVGLELGGKDPAYVRADADLKQAVETVIDGAFFNSGQCCCGIERVYVHKDIYDTFVRKAAALTATYVLGNPMDEATTLGPMAQLRLAETVRAHNADALAKGAKPLLDPAAFPADKAGTPYLAPQIFTQVDHSMLVMNEETFGPVIGIMPVASDEEAIRLMNDSQYGLTAAIFTRDEAAAQQIGEALETGTVFMNRCDYLDPGLAWTGVKDTGRGASLSSLGYESLTRPKSFHLKKL
ncbi:MAG TPA: aldehyde dehydrogenase family protein [Rhabdaerophilum sp.]|nr:aldehyde dehydrogenase family protein [Rhabdaerophilum sp.]